jgi:hypothetical protein
MLRDIISVSLVMTACATLIPTKVNAATVTVVPVGGSLQKNPGDSIDFILAFNPQTPVGKAIRFLFPDVKADPDELSALSIDFNPTTPPGSIIDFTTTVAVARFNVINSIGDGLNDISASILYQEIDLVSGEASELKATLFAPGGDVRPVPEPLTIFGTATALGCGVLFKRKSSKKTVS